MKQQVENLPNLPMHKISLYWMFAWNRYCGCNNPFALRYMKADHRITKGDKFNKQKEVNMKKIPNEIYISQKDLEDRVNIDGEVNTALLFTKPIEGLQMTRYVNNEVKWHKVITKDDVPHCDRYNEVIIIAFGIHKDKNAIFSDSKVCYWKVHSDVVTLGDDIRGLLNASEFGNVYWAHIKSFFPKFNK